MAIENMGGSVGLPRLNQQNVEPASATVGSMGGAGQMFQRRDPMTPEQIEQKRIYNSLAYKFPEARFDEMGNIVGRQGGFIGPGYYVNQIKQDLANKGYTLTKSALADYGVPTTFTDGSTKDVYFTNQQTADDFFAKLGGGQNRNIGSELLASSPMTSSYSTQKVNL